VLGIESVLVWSSVDDAGGGVVVSSGVAATRDVAISAWLVLMFAELVVIVEGWLAIFIEIGWILVALSSVTRAPVAVKHSEKVAFAGSGRTLAVVTCSFCGATPCSITQTVVVLAAVEVVWMVDIVVSELVLRADREVLLRNSIFLFGHESSLIPSRYILVRYQGYIESRVVTCACKLISSSFSKGRYRLGI